MTAAVRRRFDKSTFFDWIGHQDRRFELVDGVAVMLPWVTRNHNQITTNIVAALAARVDRTRFGIRTGDFAVETGERSIRYADVMVEPAGGDGRDRTTVEAILLVEILSETSEDTDFNEKLIEYSGLQSCDTYLICDQSKPLIWQWTRSEGVWPTRPRELEGLGNEVELRALGCRLPVTEIYFGIV